MLVLSRKRSEAIVITDPETHRQIRIVVVDIRGPKVRIGIDCPRIMSVHRKEIQDKINGVRPGGSVALPPPSHSS